ncbi:MAG: L-rhamnose mutarotase [Tepidiformaceae bacterium]
MKRLAQTILLKDDQAIAAYEAHHAAIWPEVAEGLREIGIEQMLIWRSGRRLFMVMETVDGFDATRDFARYEAGHPRRQQWQRLMESLQAPTPEAKPGEWWTKMAEVFRLNV